MTPELVDILFAFIQNNPKINNIKISCQLFHYMVASKYDSMMFYNSIMLINGLIKILETRIYLDSFLQDMYSVELFYKIIIFLFLSNICLTINNI